MFIRKVKTKSGAIAVQVARRNAGRDMVLKHLGSAHSKRELDRFIQLAQQHIRAGQQSLFDDTVPLLDIVALHSSSVFLYETLSHCYNFLNFDQLDDSIFKQLVIVRLIEPASKLDTIRILSELGVNTPSNTGIHRCLQRVIAKNYRDQICKLCFQTVQPQSLSLLLYDVTTLYFEIQKEDEFRKPGLSKERRLEPQIVIGLLVDRTGFPLELHEFEGNTAETKTIVPVITQFCQKHHLTTTQMTITADAGMLSANNLKELEAAGFYFIVGSRLSKTPYQITEHTKSHPDEQLTDGQIFETTHSFGYKKEDKIKRRVIYQYKEKRAQLDLNNIEKQVAKAQRVVSGSTPVKKVTFLEIKGQIKKLNQKLIDEHRLRAGIKGYVTNLPTVQEDHKQGVPPQEIINAYHQLFQVEKSFRMSKSDLKARPIFHHKLDAIKARLTIVFTALSIARHIERKTSLSTKKFIQKLRVIQTPTVRINGKVMQIQPEIGKDVENLISLLF
ncbi:IS1634 family transposase [Candidatus Roizmanbacteria bacterium CG10_big_fil_rev_8_21_14_0_10_39_6]|uniref:IS1634 family transposase n=1 Tax=Candidatus Roizmanbacteria bacterium CG10_big_fil_rev_8_21_14_0_10_39_6 TaxID=1974853 RepID=A0A2M8KRF5_9BACT|nr:MAG: IS1634 family transposase [Candidatus Roizmanbacteria bacterium CG10_big_fil_rev_8_21_14_0_10_39_6]